MRLMTWNIRAGGRARMPAIVRALDAQAPDIAIITEYRAGVPALGNELRRLGYQHQRAGSAIPKLNSVLIASRVPFEPLQIGALPAGHEHRVVGIRIPGLSILGTYCAQGHAKLPVFDWLIRESIGRTEPILLIGDLNTGKHYIDEVGKTFVAANSIDTMESLGWVDAWRYRHGDNREYSWLNNAGSGFRLDHAFVTAALLPRVSKVDYAHELRIDKTSDHSALMVDLDDN